MFFLVVVLVSILGVFGYIRFCKLMGVILKGVE